MTRAYKNFKHNSNTRKRRSISPEYLAHKFVRGGGSLKTAYCDEDDDGVVASTFALKRSPAVYKGAKCEMVYDPPPEVGAVGISLEVLKPETGPVDAQLEIVKPQAGPVGFTLELYKPETGPVGVVLENMKPVEGPVGTSLNVIKPEIGPVGAKAQKLGPDTGPVGILLNAVKPENGPVGTSLSALKPNNGPAGVELEAIKAAAGPVNISLENLKPQEGPVGFELSIPKPLVGPVGICMPPATTVVPGELTMDFTYMCPEPGFFIGTYLVTQAQYAQVMSGAPNYTLPEFYYVPGQMWGSSSIGRHYFSASVSVNGTPQSVSQDGSVELSVNEDPSKFKGDNKPVENINWFEANIFIRRLSEQFPLPEEWEYALPSITEWELSAGNEIYPQDGVTSSSANYTENETTDVGSYPPGWKGLYDMGGNVWEFVSDAGSGTSVSNSSNRLCRVKGSDHSTKNNNRSYKRTNRSEIAYKLVRYKPGADHNGIVNSAGFRVLIGRKNRINPLIAKPEIGPAGISAGT
jgi:formylglycine-generating enzyme required for sulfatase activity